MRRVEACMGTVFTIDVRPPVVDDCAVAGGIDSAIDEVVAWLHHVDATFSTYRPDSVISRLAAGQIEMDDCGSEVHQVLAACERYRIATGGYFDCRYAGSLDPSGYVKGWAIQRASELLERRGAANHCVNGGGDVQCVGAPEPGGRWTVGIVDPRDRAAVLATVAGERLAVATSGPAERGAHIVDPHTGTRPDTWSSVTVVGEQLTEVDVWATAAVALGPRAEEWLRDQGMRALLVRPDGSTITTS
jgi:thiamine biosynthesis lipoprotein